MTKIIPIQLVQNSYDIHVGSGITQTVSSLLNDLKLGKKTVIITHQDLAELYGNALLDNLHSAGFEATLITVPNGEISKSLTQVSDLLDQLFPLRLDRKDSIIALGGGVVGDLAGFVASLYMRGIAVIQIPTTLLAQVDSAIGGKTGVNHRYGKNLIGAFHQPKAVVADIQTLATLPPRECRAGLAEVVKYGMIWDKAFFDRLVANQDILAQLNPAENQALWEDIVSTSASIKAQVVSKDEKESNLRAILNYGHTIAHGIEAIFTYNTYLHGEAVALGMIGASRLSVALGYASEAYHQTLISLLSALGFPLTIQEPTTAEAIYNKMLSDKKSTQGTLRFVLNNGIGRTELVPIEDSALIKRIITELLENHHEN